jgi:hypothetical protein
MMFTCQNYYVLVLGEVVEKTGIRMGFGEEEEKKGVEGAGVQATVEGGAHPLEFAKGRPPRSC